MLTIRASNWELWTGIKWANWQILHIVPTRDSTFFKQADHMPSSTRKHCFFFFSPSGLNRPQRTAAATDPFKAGVHWNRSEKTKQIRKICVFFLFTTGIALKERTSTTKTGGPHNFLVISISCIIKQESLNMYYKNLQWRRKRNRKKTQNSEMPLFGGWGWSVLAVLNNKNMKEVEHCKKGGGGSV